MLEAKMAAMLFFQRHFGKYTVLRDREDEFQITVEHGKYSRLGVYITHLSLLLIMFGSATGAILGFEGGMSIEEGTRQSWMQHNKGSNGGMKTMREAWAP
jgi:cytochrome c biogenesis protein